MFTKMVIYRGVILSLLLTVTTAQSYYYPRYPPQYSSTCVIPRTLRHKVVGIVPATIEPVNYDEGSDTNHVEENDGPLEIEVKGANRRGSKNNKKNTVSENYQCPSKFPYAMFKGWACCHNDHTKPRSYTYLYSHQYACDDYYCCDTTYLKRCRRGVLYQPQHHESHVYKAGDQCTSRVVGEDYWTLVQDRGKNVLKDARTSWYNNDDDEIFLIYSGDTLLVNCGNIARKEVLLKAFTCSSLQYNSGTTVAQQWHDLDCTRRTDQIKAANVNIFMPYYLPLKKAKSNCEKLGRGVTLASIRNPREETLAVKVMLIRDVNEHEFDYYGADHHHCTYIGFTDEAREGYWRWMDGNDVTYTNWRNHRNSAEDQPNNGLGLGSENYAAMCIQQNDFNRILTNRAGQYDVDWYDVGPPRSRNALLSNNQAYSLCGVRDLEIDDPRQDCALPKPKCGLVYKIKSNTNDQSIAHLKSITVQCKEGYRMSGNSKVSCNNGVLSAFPTCQSITVVVYSSNKRKSRKGAANGDIDDDCKDV